MSIKKLGCEKEKKDPETNVITVEETITRTRERIDVTKHLKTKVDGR